MPWDVSYTVDVRERIRYLSLLATRMYEHPELQWESKAYHVWNELLTVACARLRNAVPNHHIFLSVWPQPRVAGQDPVDPDGSSFAGSDGRVREPEPPQQDSGDVAIDGLFDDAEPSGLTEPLDMNLDDQSCSAAMRPSGPPSVSTNSQDLVPDRRHLSRTSDFSTIYDIWYKDGNGPQIAVGAPAPAPHHESTVHAGFELKALSAATPEDYGTLTNPRTMRGVDAARIAYKELEAVGPQAMRQAQFTFLKYPNRTKLVYVCGMGLWWISMTFHRSRVGKPPASPNAPDPSMAQFRKTAALPIRRSTATSIFNSHGTDLHEDLKRLLTVARNEARKEIANPAIA